MQAGVSCTRVVVNLPVPCPVFHFANCAQIARNTAMESEDFKATKRVCENFCASGIEQSERNSAAGGREGGRPG